MIGIPKPVRIKDKTIMKSFETQRCVACGRVGANGHHVKTRGSGGTDDPWNLMPLDLRHHSEVHQIGLVEFALKYQNVKNWLLSNGWTYDENYFKWRGPVK